MCGVSGALGRPSPDLLPTIENIVRAQRRRGPDHQKVERIDAGAWTAVFGPNRLSIIDLNAEANQPMWDHSRRYCIVYNGEIYNYLELREVLEKLGHSFRTKSDTEVILEAFKAWGTAAFARFNGMFASLSRPRPEAPLAGPRSLRCKAALLPRHAGQAELRLDDDSSRARARA